MNFDIRLLIVAFLIVSAFGHAFRMIAAVVDGVKHARKEIEKKDGKNG